MTAILLSGCAKEGCTDENAENYNITADKDDGACIYCTGSIEQIIGSSSTSIIDTRFTSPFEDEVVLSIDLQTKRVDFPLRTCGQGGCFLIVTVTNTTDSVMSNVQFSLSVTFQDFGTTNFTFSPSGELNSGESQTLNPTSLQSMFGSDCRALSQNQFTGNINSASYN